MKKRISVRQAALCLGLCLLVGALCDLALPMSEVKVYDSVIRLHVLANSSSEEDQRIKYGVRDAILAAGCFEGARDITAAKNGTEKAAKRAVDAANAYLKEQGVDYRATYLWGVERYPTRVYEEIKLPSGDYFSLRIVLGEGEGENWWCVLFPPLCLGAAEADTKSGKVFNAKSKKYILRFKIMEWFS